MPGADVDRAVELAERRRVETAALVPAGFLPGELSLPLGVAAVSVDQAYPLEVMSRADAQLYRAKITRKRRQGTAASGARCGRADGAPSGRAPCGASGAGAV